MVDDGKMADGVSGKLVKYHYDFIELKFKETSTIPPLIPPKCKDAEFPFQGPANPVSVLKTAVMIAAKRAK